MRLIGVCRAVSRIDEVVDTKSCDKNERFDVDQSLKVDAKLSHL